MKTSTLCFVVCLSVLAIPAVSVEPALTIYNQDFGVVRENIHLDLQKGINQVAFTETTAHLEPDSVMLRDPQGKRALRILEQNFRADPISSGLLLSLYEGKTIDFLVQNGEEKTIVPGKIIRSGYVYHAQGLQRYNQQYYQTQMANAYGPGSEPIVEFEGKVRFGLPGQPLFPNLADDTILKPTLNWVLETDTAGAVDAELGYVTGGMSWEASYNLVGPEKSDKLDIVGWVTMDNQSGRTFENAQIKLMAGDVSKIQEQNREGMMNYALAGMGGVGPQPQVSEKTFDEYHLYTLERRTTLHDRETKQVEFIRADNVASERFYVYDGARIDPNLYPGWNTVLKMQNREYGTSSGTDVWVMREIKNTKENGLGMPLPGGRTRFYVRDTDNQLEFTGENVIDHTPREETLRIYTGNAFDLVGSRTQTDFKCESNEHWTDESFKITLRNRKQENAEIRVIEHLLRGVNWVLRGESDTYTKKESQLIEFRAQLKPDEEKSITYTVHYTW